MLSLIVGVKGTGKTKHLIDLTNKALAASSGSVVCLEKGNKLRYDIKHQVRLIDTSEYFSLTWCFISYLSLLPFNRKSVV